jgi:hypothetical protein
VKVNAIISIIVDCLSLQMMTEQSASKGLSGVAAPLFLLKWKNAVINLRACREGPPEHSGEQAAEENGQQTRRGGSPVAVS